MNKKGKVRTWLSSRGWVWKVIESGIGKNQGTIMGDVSRKFLFLIRNPLLESYPLKQHYVIKNTNLIYKLPSNEKKLSSWDIMTFQRLDFTKFDLFFYNKT